MSLSTSREDYLKAVAEAESEGESVTPSALVRRLEVSAPAVSMALKRLRRDGLLDLDKTGTIRLTAEGRDIADRLLRRHHLLERMLVEMFDFEWYKIHDEAERLEHAISDDFERKLRDRFGEPDSCPHGNRLGKDSPESRRARGWLPLSECPAGTGAAIRSVYERDRALLEHLDQLHLRPGASLQVRGRNWDDTLTLAVGGSDVVLGLRAAALVWVEVRS
ncbi:MAG TPA: metal-dependent transcriptional regulator [Bryobacteraceae bacterium]|nr:metal-dependent transcriptional regulator [Bryobacteraceae bacterium]